MAGIALAAKLKLREGTRAALIQAPDSYRKALGRIPAGVKINPKLAGKFGWILVFVKDQADLRRIAPRAVRALGEGGILWIAFPKGTSSMQTDLTRDTGWDVLRSYELKWVTLVSLTPAWSAFAMRFYKPGETRRSFR